MPDFKKKPTPKQMQSAAKLLYGISPVKTEQPKQEIINHIGIDPGVQTGFAVWDVNLKCFLKVDSHTIVSAMFEILRDYPPETTKIHFEDAQKRSWYGNKGREVMKGVGSVERDCKIWHEFCEHYGYEHRAVHPKDIATKTTATQFAAYTGWTERTNEHARDAAMIVWGIVK